MSAFDQLRDDFAALKARVTAEATTLRLGTYQADGSVLLPDGAALTPAAVLAYVETGDTVLVGHHLRRAWVLGKVSPDGPPDPYEPPAPTMRLQAGTVSASFGSGGVETGSVTFGQAFAAAPRVLVSLASTENDVTVSAGSITTSGFSWRVVRNADQDKITETIVVNWLAVPDGALTI